MELQVAETPQKKVVLDSALIANVAQTSEKFFQRFTGGVNLGTTYSKGNQSTKYNLSGLVSYPRERWAAQLGFSSNLNRSSSTQASTWNQVTPSFQRLLRWNNWFYEGLANFLQSSEQGIQFRNQPGRWYRALFEEHESHHHLRPRWLRLAEHDLQAIYRRPHRHTKRRGSPDRWECATLPVQQN